MLEMLNLSNKQVVLLATVAAVFLLIFILIIVLFVRQNRYFKNQNKVMKVINNDSIEEQLIKYFNVIKEIDQNNKLLDIEIENVKKKLSGALQYEGIIKYSAMAEVGGEISYSAAILDDRDTGFVITGLYYRDGMNTFVKEIINGESKSTLTPEERKAIAKAIERKQIASKRL